MQIADKIYLNGTIYTVNDQFEIAEALAIKDNKILYVGSRSDCEKFCGDETSIIDLKGRTIVPGFIEGHLHLRMYGESLLKLQIRDKSKIEILEMVKGAVEQLNPGEWLQGGMGWNNEVWDDPSYPTREELDAVSPNNPVLLPRMDGHMIWVNSKAFEVAGITDKTPNPKGGEYLRNPDGSLQGCVSNDACKPIRNIVPEPTKEQRKQATLIAQRQLLEYGVTTITEAFATVTDLNDVKDLLEDGSFKLRYYAALGDIKSAPVPVTESTAEQIQKAFNEYIEHSPEIGLYHDHFTMRAVKLAADGSVGAQSAAHFEDFCDRPGSRGRLMYTDEEMYQALEAGAKRGMQAIVHAIGDRAVDQVLRVYTQILKDYPNPDHRFRIEHFQLVTGDSRERARNLGVVVSMQAMHAPNSASMAIRRLGPDRASRAYASGLVLKVLGKVAGGSDAPVSKPAPLSGIHAGVTRTNDDLEPSGGFYPENALTREEALKSYTIWGAYAQFADDTRGSLEPGKYADFVILDKDIFSVDEHDIQRIHVDETIIDGITVYQRDSQK